MGQSFTALLSSKIPLQTSWLCVQSSCTELTSAKHHYPFPAGGGCCSSRRGSRHLPVPLCSPGSPASAGQPARCSGHCADFAYDVCAYSSVLFLGASQKVAVCRAVQLKKEGPDFSGKLDYFSLSSCQLALLDLCAERF